MSGARAGVERGDLHALLGDLVRRRVAFIERLSAHSETRLARRPHPNAWSLREVAEHVMLAERATLESIVRSRTGPPLRVRWHHPWMRRLIARTLAGRVRIPVTGRILTPGGRHSLPEIARRWSGVHDAWHSYLDRLPEERLTVPIFRHPLRVPMSAAQTLAFLRQHHDHHLAQIARLERVMPIGDR